MRLKGKVHELLLRFRGEATTQALIKNGLKVGENFSRQGGVIIDPPHCWLISIGNNVTLASRVYILAHDASTKMHTGYTKIGRVEIGDNVFVGANSTILPNVKIGNNVIIGAGSVVSKDVEDNSVVAGNPAQFIKHTSSYVESTKEKMDGSPIWDYSYTIHRGITDEMKKEMAAGLEGKIGYVE
ncbi:acyltransferase [Terribacillus saccharophilus]|uniref:acyltransferase n=1 Tax=Terribacillus saccharophilus TaxID=361277 RepID=UPI003982A9DC